MPPSTRRVQRESPSKKTKRPAAKKKAAPLAPAYTVPSRSATATSTISSTTAADEGGGMGATNRWERVATGRFGLSSTRPVAHAPTNDGATFLSKHTQRYGLREFLLSDAMNEPEVHRLRQLTALLDDGADPSVRVKARWRPHFRTSALFEASVNGEAQIVRLLLERRADPDEQLGDSRFTPLYNAALNGHAAVVEVLCEFGATVGLTTTEGLSPLYAASQEDHLACVRVLLTARTMCRQVAELGLPERLGGATALYVASQRGHPDIVDALLTYGCAVDRRARPSGSTPLHVALYAASQSVPPSETHLKAVHILLHAGASLTAQDEQGRSALDWAPEGWHAALRQSRGRNKGAGGQQYDEGTGGAGGGAAGADRLLCLVERAVRLAPSPTLERAARKLQAARRGQLDRVKSRLRLREREATRGPPAEDPVVGLEEADYEPRISMLVPEGNQRGSEDRSGCGCGGRRRRRY
jgi:ankyrin repeat protein